MEKTSPVEYKNYFSFFISQIQNTSFGNVIKRMIKYIRKTLLLSRILKYFRLILIWFQTGAYFIISATFIIILIPSALILFILVSFFSILRFQNRNKYFKNIVYGKKVIILFFGGSKENQERILSEAKLRVCENTVVILAHKNPFTFFFLGTKKDSNGIYHINMPYFFSLKRNILEKYKIETKYY